jgi:hypothetical protein
MNSYSESMISTSPQSLTPKIFWSYIVSTFYQLNDIGSINHSVYFLILTFCDVVQLSLYHNFNRITIYSINIFKNLQPLFNHLILKSFIQQLLMTGRIFFKKAIFASSFKRIILLISIVL